MKSRDSRKAPSARRTRLDRPRGFEPSAAPPLPVAPADPQKAAEPTEGAGHSFAEVSPVQLREAEIRVPAVWPIQLTWDANWVLGTVKKVFGEDTAEVTVTQDVDDLLGKTAVIDDSEILGRVYDGLEIYCEVKSGKVVNFSSKQNYEAALLKQWATKAEDALFELDWKEATLTYADSIGRHIDRELSWSPIVRDLKYALTKFGRRNIKHIKKLSDTRFQFAVKMTQSWVEENIEGHDPFKKKDEWTIVGNATLQDDKVTAVYVFHHGQSMA